MSSGNRCICIPATGFFFSLIASVYRRITFYCFVYSTMFLVCFLVANTLLPHEGGDDSDGRGSVMRL